MENRGLSQELIVKLYVENVECFTAIAFRYLRDREKARDIFLHFPAGKKSVDATLPERS